MGWGCMSSHGVGRLDTGGETMNATHKN